MTARDNMALDFVGRLNTGEILDSLIIKTRQSILVSEYLGRSCERDKILVFNLERAKKEYDEKMVVSCG